MLYCVLLSYVILSYVVLCCPKMLYCVLLSYVILSYVVLSCLKTVETNLNCRDPPYRAPEDVSLEDLATLRSKSWI